jgi:hypothetical protein
MLPPVCPGDGGWMFLRNVKDYTIQKSLNFVGAVGRHIARLVQLSEFHLTSILERSPNICLTRHQTYKNNIIIIKIINAMNN